MLQSLPPQIEPPENMASLDDRITQDQLCGELRQANPSPGTCSASSPPSVPGIDPGWTSNGCGDGSRFAAIGSEVAGLGLADYTGNLSHPFPGINFHGACMGHDRCYGMGQPRLECDASFLTTLQTRCQVGDYFSTCARIAERFLLAVRGFGDEAYAAAGLERDCTAWARNMAQNGCSE